MAKKKATGQLPVGTKIRVKPGVCVPEFPDVPCAGWTGSIADVTGRKADPQYVIEWDAETAARMPPDYVAQCESRNLLSTMACLHRHDFETASD